MVRPAGRRRRCPTEHVRQDACDLAGVAIFYPIDTDAGALGVGAVEPLDPGRRGLQQGRLATNHQNGIEPADRLEFDDALTKAALAGIHDLFQLSNDRRWSAVTDGENAD